MKITITFEDKEGGRLAISTNPPFHEMADMRDAGKRSSAMEAAMFALNKIWLATGGKKNKTAPTPIAMKELLLPNDINRGLS